MGSFNINAIAGHSTAGNWRQGHIRMTMWLKSEIHLLHPYDRNFKLMPVNNTTHFFLKSEVLNVQITYAW